SWLAASPSAAQDANAAQPTASESTASESPASQSQAQQVSPSTGAAPTAPTGQSVPQVNPVPRPSVPPPVGLTGRFAPWLQVRGEFRNRIEGFDGSGFKPDSSDGYMLDRFRLNATVTPSKSVKFVVQVQDARTFDKSAGGSAVPFRDTL